MRPLLRPGTHLLRRHDGALQLGLHPEGAVVLPDTAEVRASLDRLDGSPVEPGSDPVLELLGTHDLLVDESVLMPLLAVQSDGSPGRPAGAALARAAGPRAGDAAAALAARRARVRGFGHPEAAQLTGLMTTLLRRSGMGAAPQRDRFRRIDGLLGVLVGVGEPDREQLDPWTRDGTPYLVVRITEGRAVVGPFVVPGRTACLRCLDAHHTDADPSWPLLVRQYGEAAAVDRRDGVPEPVDPAQAALAVSWAARDLVAFAMGDRPATWSTTLTFGHDPGALESRSWLRHPECGCGWGLSATMEE